MISTKGRYALRAMIDLAENGRNAPIPLREIAERQEIPQKYLESIMAQLVHGGLAESVHGKNGGYRLTQAPETVTLGSVLRTAEGELVPTSCIAASAAPCARADICRARTVWTKLDRLVNDFADGVTLAALLQPEEGTEVLRAASTAHRAGAYYVRIQAMARRHHIPLEQEFDEHDGPQTRYIVIRDGVLPVATCRMYPTDWETMMLGRVVVLPEYRGRGLGRRTMEAAEDWARELGFRRATLESRENKVGFYEKLGYIADPTRVIHGDTFTCIFMEKQL